MATKRRLAGWFVVCFLLLGVVAALLHFFSLSLENVTLSQKFEIESSELEGAIRLAESGDLKQRRRLAKFYAFRKGDLVNALKWARSAADAGNSDDLHFLAHLLIANGSVSEGCAFLDQAKQRGHIDAQNHKCVGSLPPRKE